MGYYEYRHRVSLEETNVVGNVYFAHYVRWQGRCREMFLLDHAPELMAEMGESVALATTRVACSYHRELAAFDEVAIRMSAIAMTPSRLTMAFQYVRLGADRSEEIVAEGEQEVACLERRGARMEPAPLPQALRDAVELYMDPVASAAS